MGIPDFYDQVKTYISNILTIFGSAYYDEQLFSDKTIIKNKLRSMLNDESLKSCMKLKNF
ncbi:hypothetical protein X975_02561, partial [Stegodyphus mimosarum]